ncbi:uncharacterized protein LOC103184639 [Callorhinchus milii]|uniref:uncharacterized protein LOC103184639 n=1 Tax=Callorhinchus milii TaxID=7868 RepID=UPI001C3FA499|nr:uncharacterized protein LOC103184639 [Callorhinchus milii]
MLLRESTKADGTLALMKGLEDRLRAEIHKLDHLRLSISEALSPNSDAGFDCIQDSNEELKMSIAEHGEGLVRLNERMETLQMNTAVFMQMNTKPRVWNKPNSKRYSRWTSPGYADDTRSEVGWSPARTRRNSDAASEMSCAW